MKAQHSRSLPAHRKPCNARRMRIALRFIAPSILAVVFVMLGSAAMAQVRIMPLGDSITHGGQQHASYRYDLWFGLLQAGLAIDFVGRETEVFGGDPPNLVWYPDYFGGFDPDHEGYWGFRTDEVAGLIDAAAAAGQPDIVLVHLGTNDIGQNGAAGVVAADTNLRFIIERLRLQNPSVVILIAQIIPIGMGSSYFINEAQVPILNTAIEQIALDLDLVQSPVLLVDLNRGFSLSTMIQSDGIHPNVAGESFMASRWRAALEPLLPPGNPPPTVEITTPVDGTTFVDPAAVDIAAVASDDGSIVRVSFWANGTLIGEDTTAPYGYSWIPPELGSVTLTAEAEDDLGATTVSDPVAVNLVPAGGPIPIFVDNPSFESPTLPDGDLSAGPGNFGNWIFASSAETFLGVFNPPEESYPDAAGGETPLGADGSNAAYLFNNDQGGPPEFVEATQALSQFVEPGTDYVLRVAIGKFLPGQPFVPSSFGGYRIELRAGSTVIAVDEDSVDPPVGAFTDAMAGVTADAIDPTLIGQRLSVRLTLPSDQAPRSTHFDNVRVASFKSASQFVRGDCSADGSYDISDPITALDYLFSLVPPPARACDDACDCNDDEVLDIADVLCMLNGLFGITNPPVAPHPNCGDDPKGDALACANSPCP